MTTIKSYTDLEQSKKLAEFLPLESADMFYNLGESNIPDVIYGSHSGFECYTMCWSLAALYGILPNNKHITTTLSRGGWKIEPFEYLDNWWCEYEDEVDEDSPCKNFSVSADNPVDACYDMIIRLHELKML